MFAHDKRRRKKVKKQGVKAIDRDSRLKIKGMLIGKNPLSSSNQTEWFVLFKAKPRNGNTIENIEDALVWIQADRQVGN